MTSQSELFELLSGELRATAIDLEPYGVHELAFPITVARLVLDQIVSAGQKPLGGDLWSRSDDDSYFSPTGENWYINLPDAEAPADWLSRMRSKAEGFIDRHRSDSRSFVTFVLA